MIKELFEKANKNKFSYVLIVKENIDHDTFKYLQNKIDRVNIVAVKRSDLENIEQAVSMSHLVITGLGDVLDECVKQGKPVLVDASNNVIERSYPQNVDFFDPYRNYTTKPFYTEKDLDLLCKEVYNQLDRFKIDYVNIKM